MNKPLVLIVEGIDHIGKTTWIKDLIKPDGFLGSRYKNIIYYRDLVQLNTIRTVMPYAPPEFLDIKHYGILIGIINMLNAMKGTRTSFVFDRLHLSGAAYAMALRNNDQPFKFNRPLERMLLDTVGKDYDIKLATFIVKNDKFPTTDEVVNAEQLELVNEKFKVCHANSILDRAIFDIKLDEHGMSDIMEPWQTVQLKHFVGL